MSISKTLASVIAAKVTPSGDWELTRDAVDMATGGEFDCFRLDMLTDWVAEIHRKSDIAIAIDEIQTEREDREEAEAERLHNLSLKDPS
jgi:hypothetical protein